MVRRKVTEIMDRFQCDEFKAINFLLQLASEEEKLRAEGKRNVRSKLEKLPERLRQTEEAGYK